MSRGRRGTGIPVDPERVRKARLEAGLTLATVAGSDFSRTLVHQIERGLTRPSADVLAIIARRTGKQMDYFVPRGQSAQITRAQLNDELTKALDLVTDVMTAEKQKATTRMSMRSIADALRRAVALARVLEESPTD